MHSRPSRNTWQWVSYPRNQSIKFAVAVATVIALTAGCSGDDNEATTTTTVVPETTTTTLIAAPLEAGTQLYVYNPSINDCFEKRLLDPQVTGKEKQVEITLLLPCELPHRNEVFDIVTFDISETDEGAYPGESALRAFAKRECITNFASYVGLDYELSILEVGYVIPTATNWVPSNPVIGCYVFDPTVELSIGSLRNARK